MMEFLTTCEIAKHSYIKHCFSNYQSISCSRKSITNSTRKSTILPGWRSILWLCFNCSSNFMQRSEHKRTCIIINVIIICTEMRFWVIKVLITHIYLYFTFNVLKREISVVSFFQLISFYIEKHVCIYNLCTCNKTTFYAISIFFRKCIYENICIVFSVLWKHAKNITSNFILVP